MRIAIIKHLKIYTTKDGRTPFLEWLESLDNTTRYRVKERLDRITLGNFGDHKSLSNGINELRLTCGSGYRIYYGNKDNTTTILFCGGSKATQKKDIKKAITYLTDYLSR